MVKNMLKDLKELVFMYNISIEALEKYMEENKKKPSEKEWNQFAKKNNYLSSESIGYIVGTGFNKLCRKKIKEITKKKT